MKKLSIEWGIMRNLSPLLNNREDAVRGHCEVASGTGSSRNWFRLYRDEADRGKIPESNPILFNGLPLEELHNGAKASENQCASCACLTGSTTSCQTVEYYGKTYEEIPEELIRKAGYKVIGLTQR